VGGGGGCKNPTKKKKNWVGGREKIKLQKETEIRAEKRAKKKKSTWDGTRIEKRNPSVHHPSTLVHWWVLVHSGHTGRRRRRRRRRGAAPSYSSDQTSTDVVLLVQCELTLEIRF
jgi:hypothetical protein